MAALDARRLASLAKAARKAGITRLRVGDLEFELGDAPVPARAPREVPAAPAPVEERWTVEAMRDRFRGRRAQ